MKHTTQSCKNNSIVNGERMISSFNQPGNCEKIWYEIVTIYYLCTFRKLYGGVKPSCSITLCRRLFDLELKVMTRVV